MTDDQLVDQFQKIEDDFNAAVVSNKVERIKKCITSDWVLVDAQGGIIPQERFFDVLEQGLLSHSSMTKKILRVKVYGDMALCTGRGQNTGSWQGHPMEADEWITDVYTRVKDEWRCVLTHLTPVKSDPFSAEVIRIADAKARSLRPLRFAGAGSKRHREPASGEAILASRAGLCIGFRSTCCSAACMENTC